MSCCSRNLLNHSQKSKNQNSKTKNKQIHHRIRNEPDKALQFFIFGVIEQFSFKIFSYLAASKMKPWTKKANESHDRTGDIKPSLPLHKKHHFLFPPDYNLCVKLPNC